MVTKETEVVQDTQAELREIPEPLETPDTANTKKERRGKSARSPLTKFAAVAGLIALILFLLQYLGAGGGPGGYGPGLGESDSGGADPSDRLSSIIRNPEPPEELSEPELIITPRPEQTEEPDANPTAALTPSPTEAPRQFIEIRVVERQIWVDGTLMEDFDALKAYIDTVHTDEMEYRLVDAHAIHNTYNSVLELLSTKTNNIDRSLDY